MIAPSNQSLFTKVKNGEFMLPYLKTECLVWFECVFVFLFTKYMVNASFNLRLHILFFCSVSSQGTLALNMRET